MELSTRYVLGSVALFFLTVFFFIPITFVQGLADVTNLLKLFPFLKGALQGKYALPPSFLSAILPFCPFPFSP